MPFLKVYGLLSIDYRLKRFIRDCRLTINDKRLGFTMIELLIAVSIIAILAGIGTYSYTNAQAKARDTRRKQDLAQVKAALSLYFEDNKQYPPAQTDTLGSGGNTCATETTTNMTFCPSDTGGTWIPSLTNYIQKLPEDPKQAGLINTLANLIRISGKESKEGFTPSEARGQVTGTLSQDGTFIIGYSKQINVLGSTTYLQNDALAGD